MVAVTSKRVFKVGSMQLEDPAPGQPLEEAVRMLSRNFPQFRSYRLYEDDGVPDGDRLVYNLRTPPAKDNG